MKGTVQGLNSSQYPPSYADKVKKTRQQQQQLSLSNNNNHNIHSILNQSLATNHLLSSMQKQQQQQQQQQQQVPRHTSSQQTFRMVPAQSVLANANRQVLNAAALQSYAYPYNYSNLQPMSQNYYVQNPTPNTKINPLTANVNNLNQPLNQTVATNTNFNLSTNQNVSNMSGSAYSQSQSQSRGQRGGGMMGSKGRTQRNFYDPNMTNNQNQSNMSTMTQNYNTNTNPNKSSNFNSYRPSNRGSRGGYGRGGSSYAYNGARAPSSNHKPRPSAFKNMPTISKKTRSKMTDAQLKVYENAAERDVLCWMFENHGQCRFGKTCQWLHLDRETGQYIPTVYIMNSLQEKSFQTPTQTKADDEKQREEEKEKEEKETEEAKDTPQEPETKDGAPNKELQQKFCKMMETKIKLRIEEEQQRKEQEKKEDVDQQEEDNKEDEKEEEDKEKGQEAKKDKKSASKAKGDNVGNYGTTYDRFNVCWEFNTFVGCRKGQDCKWKHLYLLSETAHPFTGEKLNGRAVKKFRLSNNI